MERLSIEYHPDAVAEAAESRRWYAEIEPALGDAFADELDQALEQVAETPERWARHLHGTRGLMLLRFPYLVVYRLRDDVIQIVAVQHSRRRPGYWKSRVSTDE